LLPVFYPTTLYLAFHVSPPPSAALHRFSPPRVPFALTGEHRKAICSSPVSAKGTSGLKGTPSAQSGSKQLWENLGTLRTARDRPPHPSPITSRYLPLPPAGRENLQPQIRQAPSKTPLSW